MFFHRTKTRVAYLLPLLLVSQTIDAQIRSHQADLSVRARWTSAEQIEVSDLPRFGGATPRAQLVSCSQLPLNPVDLSVIQQSRGAWSLRPENLTAPELRAWMKRDPCLRVLRGEQVLWQTAIALQGVLDDLFYTDAPLGPQFSAKSISISVWAPSATQVKLRMFEQASAAFTTPDQVIVMEEKNGVWSAHLPRRWEGRYYQFQVTVWHPTEAAFLTHNTTDPYSVSLSANSVASLLVDVDSEATRPPGWQTSRPPAAVAPGRIVIYESHLRDLTAADPGIPLALRGKYLGLASSTSKALQHLSELAQSGVTHLHLLPLFDFATVPERDSEQAQLPASSPGDPLELLPAQLDKIRHRDSYNWGYDPVHYFSPEGSYATDPDGVARIRELRTLAMALNRAGLHLVQDVVFNHTYSGGLDSFSVLQKIVPLYYYRLRSDGRIADSSCCADTASESLMFERLMRDALVHWARTYRVTGFRFDLMSFHSRATMLRLRDALRDLTWERDGVDGASLYIYGEGWSFGSLYDRAPQDAFTQANGAGSGIGFFNDRMRDALRGGTTSPSELSDQGVISGLWDDFNFDPRNRNTPTTDSQRKEKFLHLLDVVKIGLAGNLRNFWFREHRGTWQRAQDISFRGVPAATAESARENIAYVSAHDGTTLWDALNAKLPFTANGYTAPLSERVRRHQLGLSVALLSQGVPFIEGGSELLRSKCGDTDSYDSGDVYNEIDWSLQDNGWGKALPPGWKNLSEWPHWRPRLLSPNLHPQSSDISSTLEFVHGLLRLRQQYSVFQMMETSEIQRGLEFLDSPAGSLFVRWQRGNEIVLAVWNFTRSPQTLNLPSSDSPWRVAPVYQEYAPQMMRDLRWQQQAVQVGPLSLVVLIPAKP